MDFLVKTSLLVVAIVALGTSLRADDGSAKAPGFDKAVPSDSVFFLHWQSDRKSGFAATHLLRLRRALLVSGFLDRYVSEYLSTLDAEERSGADEEAERWKKVLSEVSWWRLLVEEFSLCSRVSADGRFETAVMFRVGESRREKEIQALLQVLYAIAGAGTGLELEVGSRNGVSTAVLYNRVDYGEQLCVTGWRDVVMLSTSTILARHKLHLLEGRGLDVGLVYSKRFRDSRAALAASTTAGGGSKREASVPGGGLLDVWLDPAPIFRGFSLLDVVSTYQFQATFTAKEIQTSSIWTLTEQTDSPLHQAMASQPSARDLLAKVPATAKSWSVSAGSKPAALYDFFLEFAVTVTGQAEMAEHIERSLSSGPLRLRGDLLSNLTGRRLAIGVPQRSKGQSSLTAVDHVFAFEVLDEARARKALDALASESSKILESWNIGLKKTGDGGPYVLDFPLLREKAYVGVTDGFIALATSEAALSDLVGVAAGKVESLMAQKKLDWIPAEGDIDQLSTGTWSGTLEISSSLAQLLGVLGTILPDSGGSGAMKPFCVSAPKLIPAIEALDFLGETRSTTVRKGDSFFSSSTTTLELVEEF